MQFGGWRRSEVIAAKEEAAYEIDKEEDAMAGET
jgi:hypothetical protein